MFNENFKAQHSDNQRQADRAFERAINDGILSDDCKAANYAGNYMFMGVSQDSAHKNAFKNRNTRQYIYA